VRDELQRQLLVEVLPEWTLQPETIHIVFLSHRGLLPSVRALIDFLVDEFEAINDE
jgi:DNA-binding transcriptional LysR family regulator